MSSINRSATHKLFSLAGFALVAGLTLQPTLAAAGKVNPRDFQAYGYEFQIQGDDHGQWRKANGAEILGGFAGPDDQVNTSTGEVRHR
jgi:hypothetical protein